jgi:hypothetical protein
MHSQPQCHGFSKFSVSFVSGLQDSRRGTVQSTQQDTIDLLIPGKLRPYAWRDGLQSGAASSSTGLIPRRTRFCTIPASRRVAAWGSAGQCGNGLEGRAAAIPDNTRRPFPAWGSAGQRGTGGGIATMWGSAATAALVAGGSGGAETRGWFYDGRGLEENGDGRK